MRVYGIAICGMGMGSLAGLLKAAGHEVLGSDQNIYPPMSDYLAQWGVRVLEGFHAEHLDASPDLVVVGNAVRRDNPEAREVMNRGLDYVSMPGALERLFFPGREVVAVTGTHGKDDHHLHPGIRSHRGRLRSERFGRRYHGGFRFVLAAGARAAFRDRRRRIRHGLFRQGSEVSSLSSEESRSRERGIRPCGHLP
ncbi:MAG: Mur ligase domain-containing protein [Deltaproteobacteria bacterium]|nr:Mur ligase domain-containing protein [Deltaproteobacteria bacterium]